MGPPFRVLRAGGEEAGVRDGSLPVGWRCCGWAGVLYGATYLPALRSA
ncbi:hypothetical protein FHS66_001007 [Pacificitalea manganoxidans]|nr:hypothetical protein [Pacificitalea manganoxidans]